MHRSSLFVAPFVLCLAACGGRDLPDTDSEAYRTAVTAFYQAVAAVQAGEEVGAREGFERVTEVAPAEPAAWANLGLLSLRRNDFDASNRALNRARNLAPENAHIEVLLGHQAAARGDYAGAASHYERAFQLDSTNVKAAYALAQELEREASAPALQRAFEIALDLSGRHPENLALAIEAARLSIRTENAAALQETLDLLTQRSAHWPEDVRQQFASLQDAAGRGDLRSAATSLSFVRNLLLRLPAYRLDLAEIQTPIEQPGDFLTHFIALPAPSARPSPPDTTLRFSPSDTRAAAATHAGLIHVDAEAAPILWTLSGNSLQIGSSISLSYPGSASLLPPDAHPIAVFDFDYDYQPDLAVVGDQGFRLYRGDGQGGYADVTAATSLRPDLTASRFTSVWVFDVDLEGDLDLLLARSSGPPVVLRNNADGTFTRMDLFPEVNGVTAFAWGDLDADADPDVALVDAAGSLHVFLNDRSNTYRRTNWSAPASVVDVAVADVDADGLFELLVLGADGAVVVAGEGITLVQPASLVQSGRLLAGDLDNNGAIDLVVSGAAETSVYLGDAAGISSRRRVDVDARVVDLGDVDGDGRLDLAVVGQTDAALLRNEATFPYQWQVIRPRSAQATGDQRINTFGIGGQIEIRSGLLFQKQVIGAPQVHFGLGDRTESDVARIVWPNGDVQAEFNLAADQPILTQQRLKGSCPWVFAYDGESMAFITDFIWRSPLGLAINGQEQAGVVLTADRIKIGGDQLAPRNGVYDIRITAELWETHFFDEVSLIVVDHPEGTEVFVDERFSIPPPSLEPQVMRALNPVKQARDQAGADVTAIIAARDGSYLGSFERGRYQGVARDHYVEIELGPEVPRSGPVWLVAHGWVRPTDSSINVALGQGRHEAGRTLSLEVQTDDGSWQVVGENLGFPAGKTKTLLFPIGEILTSFPSGKLRLRTNLEIYWDAIHWAEGVPEAELRQTRVLASRADLLYRGYSEVTVADASSPEIPHYDRLQTTARRWYDLEGYYTRFGDVRELLAEVDDRYVIMNAGDEMRFEFPVLPPPEPGFVRDFFLQGDGWVKDGDYNTTYSTTVRPLPLHEDTGYQGPLVPLQEDPGYLRHPSDWQDYHTRYVAPDGFSAAMRVASGPEH